MNDFAIIYHWWSDNDAPVVNNLSDPVIFSIIGVRHFHKDIPIYVLDVSQTDKEWQNYPDLLNFEVIKRPAPLKKLKSLKLQPVASRIWDINWLSNRIAENKIIFCDSDVFWTNPIFPLIGLENDPELKQFHCGMNNGLFYYDKNSDVSRRVWHKTEELAISHGWDHFANDEQIFRKVLKSNNFFTPVNFKENNIIFAGGYDLFNYRNPTSMLNDPDWGLNSSVHSFSKRFAKDCKNIHVMRRFGGESRGKVFTLIDELKCIMLEFLRHNDANVPLDFNVKSFPYSEFSKAYALNHFYDVVGDSVCWGYDSMIKGYLVRNTKFC
jgi:hypothetical protein